MKAGEAKPSPKEGAAHPGKGVGQGTPCQSCICRKFRWIPGGIKKVLEKAICGDLLNKQTTPGSENLAQQKKLEAGNVSGGQPVPADTNLILSLSLLPAAPDWISPDPLHQPSNLPLLPKAGLQKENDVIMGGDKEREKSKDQTTSTGRQLNSSSAGTVGLWFLLDELGAFGQQDTGLSQPQGLCEPRSHGKVGAAHLGAK